MERTTNAIETTRSVFAQVIAQTIISQNNGLVKKAMASVTTQMQHCEHCEELQDVIQADEVAALVCVPCQGQSEMSLSSQTPPFLVILFSLCA